MSETNDETVRAALARVRHDLNLHVHEDDPALADIRTLADACEALLDHPVLRAVGHPGFRGMSRFKGGWLAVAGEDTNVVSPTAADACTAALAALEKDEPPVVVALSGDPSVIHKEGRELKRTPMKPRT